MRIGKQYLRARYYDAAIGTFNRLDPFAGDFQDPQSLHKYLYTHGDPVNGSDPTGLFAGLIGAMISVSFGGDVRSRDAAQKGNVFRRAVGNKQWTVHFATGTGGKAKEGPIRGGLNRRVGHMWLVVTKKGGKGFRYDVGAPGGFPPFGKAVPGRVRVRFGKNKFLFEYSWFHFPFARLSTRQYVLWHAIVITRAANPADRDNIDLSLLARNKVPGTYRWPFGLNCYVWTIESSFLAVVIQFCTFREIAIS